MPPLRSPSEGAESECHYMEHNLRVQEEGTVIYSEDSKEHNNNKQKGQAKVAMGQDRKV